MYIYIQLMGMFWCVISTHKNTLLHISVGSSCSVDGWMTEHTCTHMRVQNRMVPPSYQLVYEPLLLVGGLNPSEKYERQLG